MLLDDLSPSTAFMVKVGLGIAIFIVSVALGMVVGRQNEGSRYWKQAGWLVGLSCFFMLQVMAKPVRAHLYRAECQKHKGDAESYAVCIEEGAFDLSDGNRDE
jgi:hypothetical protein